LYCDHLVLEKFQVFNKQVTREQFEKIFANVREHLPFYLHPKNLTAKDIAWLKKNVKQFDRKVLNKVIKNSHLPDKPVELK
jgi:hypothetical protein